MLKTTSLQSSLISQNLTPWTERKQQVENQLGQPPKEIIQITPHIQG